MKELNTYRVKWAVKGNPKVEFTELKAPSEEAALQALHHTKAVGISIMKVELVDGPDASSAGVACGPRGTPNPPLVTKQKISDEK